MAGGSRRAGLTIQTAFFLSGAAGLGYEVVWTRQFGVGLGHEYVAVLAVVSAFFGGVALGAWAGDRRIAASRQPGRIYALLELAIGLWAAASLVLVPRANDLANGLLGLEPSAAAHWAVAFALPFLTLLPATAAMGATLPAIERLTARLRGDGQRVAGLYALNTVGAASGILASHTLLLPNLGLQASILALAGVNLACAGLVWFGSARGEEEREEVEVAMEDTPGATVLRATAFGTGLLGIGYEVLGIRVMGQVLENTVFSFAAALVAYLVGSSIGAGLYQRLAAKQRFVEPFERLLLGQALACGGGLLVLSESKALYAGLRAAFGLGPVGSVVSELALGLCVFGLPAALMGATFSHLAQAARRGDGGVGGVLGFNTLGSALASLVFGVLLLPLLGAKLALCAVVLGYVALMPRRRLVKLAQGAAAVGVLYLYAQPLWLVEAGEGRMVKSVEGRMAAVAVVDRGEAGRALKINDRFRMGSTGPGEFGARRLGHLPLLLHPAPERALFLGVGTGVTLAAAAYHPGLETLGVELMPEVLDVLEDFRAGNAPLLDSDRMRVIAGDARRCVQAAEKPLDVIVADLFHPGRDGAGSLYTVEHFETVRGRLAPGGLFCQWVPLYQVDEQVLRLIVRSFLHVFPESHAFLGQFNAATPALALVGALEPLRFEADHYARRVEGGELALELERKGLRGVHQLLGTWITDRAGLAGWAGDGPLNTDDRPLIAYTAPALAYAADDVPGQHTGLLLDLARETPDGLLTESAAASALGRELAEYFTARDLYLRASQAQIAGDAVRARERMIESALASPLFRTAYQVLLVEAESMAQSRPQEAIRILEALEQGLPELEEATIVRRRLFRGR